MHSSIRLIAFFSCLLFSISLSGQIQFSREYGDINTDDDGRWMEQLPDSGFIITGGSTASGSMDFRLIRTDSSGNVIWTKNLGGPGFDFANMVKPTRDNGFIVAGLTSTAGDVNGWIVKTDSAGNRIWSRTLGGTGTQEIKAIIPTIDGGYAAAGYNFSPTSLYYDAWLIKLNATGTVQWQKNIGGRGYDRANAVQQTPDGGYILAGQTYNYGNRDGEVYLIKTDVNGNVQWEKAYGTAGLQEAHYVQLTNNGYIIVGDADSLSSGFGQDDVWVLRTDLNGDTLWTANYGGSKKDGGKSIENTRDGGFIIGGITRSFSLINPNFYLLKTDSLGVIQWSTYTYGSAFHDHAYRTIETSDGGYAAFGFFRNAANYLNFALIKLGPNGAINKDIAIDRVVEPDTIICSNPNTSLRFRINNFGTTNEIDIAVVVTISDGVNTTTIRDTLYGQLNPSTQAILTLSTTFDLSAPGTYQLTAYLPHQPGDVSFSNDTITSSIHVLANTGDPRALPVAGCTSAFTLEADAVSIEDSLFWFTTPGGELTAAGSSYYANNISSNTSYFVMATKGRGDHVGESDNSIGSGNTSNNGVLKFDVRRQIKLISVKVYAPSPGVRTIELRDPSGAVLQSKTVDLPAGEQRVYLNFDIPEGNDYQLGLSPSSFNLFRNSDGALFPYSISRTIEIYGTNSTSPGTYYYFYDWYVFTPYDHCNSNYVEVSVIVESPASALDQNICNGASATFTATAAGGVEWYDTASGGSLLSDSTIFVSPPLTNSTVYYLQAGNCPSRYAVNAIVLPNPIVDLGPDTLLIGAGQTITLDAGPGFISYVWNNFSTTQTVTINTPGIYSVLVTDSNGCTATDSVEIVFITGIRNPDEFRIGIFPNPAKDHVIINVSGLNHDTDIGLFNSAGKCVLKDFFPKQPTMARKYDISFLPPGIYLFRLINTERTVVKKLIIQ